MEQTKKWLEWIVIVVCVFMLFRIMVGTFPHWRSMVSDVQYHFGAFLSTLGG